MKFVFPTVTDELEEFTDLDYLKDKLQRLSEQESIKVSYRFIRPQELYLYARCRVRKCRAQLRYHRKEGRFRLIRIEAEHNHSEKRKTQTYYESIQTYIKELPQSMPMIAAKTLACRELKISESQFYYFNKKLRNQELPFNQLLQSLNELKCQSHSHPFYEQMRILPQLLVIVSPLMKDNYKRFGQWVGFDLTFNLVKNIHESGKRWKVGCFMGISSTKKLVPFGLVIMLEETKQRCYQMFKAFFDIMNRSPQTIITDQGSSMKTALEQLKQDREFSGQHLLDSFHILKNVHKKLSKKEHLQCFRKLMYCRNDQEYEELLRVCYETLENENDTEVLRNFLQKSSMYCFSQTPLCMFGFLPSNSMNEKIHDLIKRIIPLQQPYTVVIIKIMRYLEEIGLKAEEFEFEKTKCESIFLFPELKDIRYTLAKPVFQQFQKEFASALYMTADFFHGGAFVNIKEEKHELTQYTTTNQWVCPCFYMEKTGLPCRHILKVLITNRERINPYIHDRWRIASLQQSRNKGKKRRMPRKTRRNMMK